MLHAGPILLDSGAGNGGTSRGAGSGAGTGVSVATTTNLTQMAMSLDMPNGGDIKYMIWDDTDTNLLFSDIVAVGASGTTSYVLSNPFSFTLNAGSTYFFGVIGDNNLNIDFIFPPTTVTQNGLTTLDTGNTNYLTFASPTPTDGGGVTFTLQLFGDQGSAVPEPSTWMLVSGGVGLIAFFRRKRAAVN